jgi:hypothetical protein
MFVLCTDSQGRARVMLSRACSIKWIAFSIKARHGWSKVDLGLWSEDMRNFGIIVALLALVSCAREEDKSAGTKKGQALPMTAGLWETKVTFTEVKATGLSDKNKQKLLADVSEQLSGQACLTEEQARKPDADFFAGSQSDDCKYKKFDIKDGKLDLTLTCNMNAMATVDMDMKGKVGATALDLDVAPSLRLPMIGDVELRGKAEGRYLGACPKAK